MKKTIIIGDVHGCYFTLKKLLKQLPADAEVIFIGDLCDRGNYSKEVIELVMKNHNYKSVLGNHEDYMLTYAQDSLDGKPNRWIDKEYMGGKETLRSYENSKDILNKHLKWIEKLPLYFIKEPYFITHGFALPYFKRRGNEEKKHSFLVNRLKDKEEWQHDFEDGYEEYGLINVFGHEDFKDVQIDKTTCAIDTGCVYGNKLSAIELGSMKVYEQHLHPLDTSEKSIYDFIDYFQEYSGSEVLYELYEDGFSITIELESFETNDARKEMPKGLRGFLSEFKHDVVGFETFDIDGNFGEGSIFKGSYKW